MRRRILLVSALSAAIMIIAAPAAFAFDLGDLGRNVASLPIDIALFVAGLF